MVKIVPAILTNDETQFQKFLQTYSSFSKRIHIDITDGSFTPNKTIQLSQISALPTGVQIDLHLMTATPSTLIPEIIRVHPTTCILHAEAAEDLSPSIAQLKKAGIKVGIALLQKTYPGHVKTYLKNADSVLIFAGALGKQGGSADLLQQEKIKIIRSINQEVEIGWDGGVNSTNVRALSHVDLDVLNVGSAISATKDPSLAYKQLCEEAEKTGVAL